MKKILFSLFFLLISINPVSAWEETFEGHPNDADLSDFSSSAISRITTFQDGHSIGAGSSSAFTFSVPWEGYLGYSMWIDSYNQDRSCYIWLYNDSTVIATLTYPGYHYGTGSWERLELVESTDGSKVSLKVDGTEIVNDAYSDPSLDITSIYIHYTSGTGLIYFDDFSTYYYTIGHQGFVSAGDSTVYFSVTVPDTVDYTYHTNLETAAGVTLNSWNVSAVRTNLNHTTTSSFSGDGIYYLSIYGQDDAFYYTKPVYYFADGIFPDTFFLVETDTAADIRDENNGGGAVTGGGTVYLYPDTSEDGWYNISCDFSEQAYSRDVVYTKVYNTTELNGSILSFSGLSTASYNVSIDGNLAGQTNGNDTWSYNTTWAGNSTYEFDFEPDLSIPGVWGYVKNSETQTGVKSAHVTISNDTFSTTLDTDINGMYYYTSGIVTNELYTVDVTKSGYTAPASQTVTTKEGLTTRQDFFLDQISTDGAGLYYAPHDVTFTIFEHWYSGAGLQGVQYSVFNGSESVKTGSTDSKGMFAVEDMNQGTNYTIVLQYNGSTYTKYVEPGLTEYIYILNNAGVLHQYANSWLTLSFTENTNNVTIAYESNKTITGASLTAIANNGTTVYSQTLNTTTGSFTFETGGEGDYTLNFHIQATDGDTAFQSWGLSYPNKVPLFPDEYPAWLKNILFSGIVIVFLLSFGKAKNDIACGAVAILTSMGYIFEWFTCSFYFVVLVWIIALGAVFLHYKRTGGIG